MSIIQKHVLPHKINKLTIKLKSYAFMKIFMTIDNPIQPKSHKIRHYDLELEGATAISGWIKKKLQQVYLRGFLQIKDTQPQLVSLKYLKQPPSPPQIEKLNFKNISVKSTGKFINSDRSQNEKIKMPSYSTQQLLEKSSMEKVQYRSQYGGSNLGNKLKKQRQNQKQQDDKKSNLMSLLDKVRKVNSQSKQDKENYQRNEPIYGLSYENSRVMSSHSAYGSNDLRWNDKGKYHMKQQQTARLNTVNSQYNNDMSFCAYGQTQRVNSINNLKSIRNNHCVNRQPQRVSQNYTPVTYQLMNIEQQESMDKNSLMSLRKWHKNQKRNIIMQKINQLQKSLMYADNSQIYTSRDYYEIPMGNYSQGYLNMRTQRQPVRNVVEVRVRK